MQVCNIRVIGRDPHSIPEIAEVRYRKGFKMFGERFVCHRNPKHEHLKTVTHFKSGIAIAHEDTYKNAMAEAKRLLTRHCNERQDFVHLLEDYAGDWNLNPIEIN